MRASFVDLRKKSSEIIGALDRNESITLFYRGRPKAILRSLTGEQGRHVKVRQHPAFGLWKDRDDLEAVATHVRKLRKGRFDAL